MKHLALVADENIASSTILALRGIGYRVTSIAETMPGVDDEIVLNHACSIYAVLLTFDRDYGELIFKRRLGPPHAVLYLRSVPASPVAMTEIIEGLLSGRLAGDIGGYFVVWAQDGIRKRAFARLD